MRSTLWRSKYGWMALHLILVSLDKLRAAGSVGGWNVVFDVQPSNSPDLNWLDLCFFYSQQQGANKLKGAS